MATTTRKPEPFDILAAIGELLERSGVTFEALRNADAAGFLDRTTRELAADFLRAPVEHRSALRAAALCGYLAALGKGFQLGAEAVHQWRTDMLNVATQSYETGALDAEAYGFILGLLMPDRNLVITDDVTRVVH
jgi:hypothetical protein